MSPTMTEPQRASTQAPTEERSLDRPLTRDDVPLDATVWSLFESCALRHPQRTAVVDGDAEIPYQHLLERVRCIAGELASRGVEPGSLVGVCMGRTWELLATLMGVLRAGCAYVPLDPSYPRERIRYMVQHAGLAAAIVDHDAAAELCTGVPQVLRLDGVGQHAVDALPGPSPTDLAYVLYTSGSTGRPKGVAVEHRSIVSLSRTMEALHTDEELSGVLAAASVCFDASVMELLGTLSLGGTVILAQNVLQLPELPAAHRVRLCVVIPSAMKVLLAAGYLPAGIRCIVMGAEVLTRSLADQVLAQDPQRRLINVYGPTEDTVYSTTSEITVGAETVTIGTSVQGSRSYILDDALQPVPVDVEGELYLAGEKLARGYLYDDERTRERFLDTVPSDAVPEHRLYKTGDLCRRRKDGQIEFLGRIDQQVKIRGHRVELEEIEAVLESMDGVDGAATMATDSDHGHQMLVGYVVNQDGSVTSESVRSFLSERLPGYMVPQVIQFLDELPRLPNDKLDRKALPKSAPSLRYVGRQQLSKSQTATPSRDELLSTVRGEIASLLRFPQVDDVPADEYLDALGLDSLSKVELSSRLGAALDLKLPISAILESPTPSAVADCLLGLTGDGVPKAPVTAHQETAPTADALGSFQSQIQQVYPPFLASRAPSWCATDKGTLVHELKQLVSRPGDPFCKLVRGGSGARGVVADVDTDRVRDTIIWTTNLYLGLNRDPQVIQAARDAVERFGTGMGTSAAASGITDVHVEFEQAFADLVGMESACLFPTGYTANVGAVAGLLDRNDVIIMDQLCHASIVDGARLCGATIRTFQHNNPADLEAVLKTEASPYRTVLVVIEGVYSMGEGAAPVAEIARTAKKYNALVLVDEAHSFGFYGPRGGGICAAQGATEQVDFIMTTLSKALGSLGGVVAARKEHVSLLKSSSRAFIFQASTSPADIAAAMAALERLRDDDSLRERLWDTTAYMRQRFTEAGYDLGTGDGPIVTPHFYDKEKLFAVVNGLFERGVHTSAVTYPIVEVGKGRLRFICSAAHTREDVDKTVEALIETEREVDAMRAANEETVQHAQPERDRVEARIHSFATYLKDTAGSVEGPAPDLAVSFLLPNDDDAITLRFQDRNVSVEEGPCTDLPSCSLLLGDQRTASALCTSDVQGLLDGMLSGGCELHGRVEPFVWLIGRLASWQRDLAG